MGIASRALTLRANRRTASIRTYYPAGTIKCDGVTIYRSQVSRDAACMFDFDPAIIHWKCLPFSLPYGDEAHVPDFEILDTDGCLELVDAPDRDVDVELLAASARRIGMSYRQLRKDEIYGGPRLRNAKDLLRYANYQASLGDRLRLLAGLDEHGTLTVAESLAAFTETKAVAGLASLILQGFVSVDLDAGLIGPETALRRITRDL
ncbi:hypothetical protein E0H51_31590 [Rhizobium leguminosarum bv. viciae]|uniref:hypothetical protein n=1 Tax=Rhizobium leguminosarum TaxID=384 RepID=UPI00103B0D4D|nr:hypothetical protein [Rhizobium leguminosarum]TBY68985.1 hypothetical protein E0H51_31590 [Rhizobium leguminosarum bv. viciae]